MNFLEKNGSSLIDNRYSIIPILEGTKRPGLKGWQNIKAKKEDLGNWVKNSSYKGVGVLTGDSPAVDIDVLDPEIVKEIVTYCKEVIGPAPVRIGKFPKTILVYRTDKPFKKITSSIFEDSSGNKHRVEILGEGQQFVAYAIHPDTKEPYSWPEKSVIDIPREQLSVLTEEKARGIVEKFESIVPKEWKKVCEVNQTNQGHNKSVDKFANLKSPLDILDSEIKNALSKLNSDDYELWIKIGMALYHQFDGKPEGFEVWDEWSSESAKYDSALCKEKWLTFKTDHSKLPTTFATVLHLVKNVKQKKPDESTVSLKPLSVDFREVQKKLGPINWLVKNYIEEDTTGLFFGDPGSYKSFLAMDIAYHCATGKNWHGSKVKQGPVYYIAGEGHGGLARRQEAWFKHHKPDLSKLHFKYTTGAMDFYEEKSAELISQDIEQWTETAGNPVLIVIDTLARNFNGDENTAGDMGKFINNVNQYLRVPFGCVVLIVHHSGHNNKTRARGSTALRAGIDFEYLVEKDKSDSLIAKLYCTKMKDAVAPEETWFTGEKVLLDLEEDIDSLVFEKIEVTKKEKPLKPEIAEFLELAKGLADPEGIVDRVKLREEAVEKKIAKDLSQVRGYIRHLEQKKLIEVFDDQKQIQLLEGD
jgi:hypothetical protein